MEKQHMNLEEVARFHTACQDAVEMEAEALSGDFSSDERISAIRARQKAEKELDEFCEKHFENYPNCQL